jgi:hypothetical protein
MKAFVEQKYCRIECPTETALRNPRFFVLLGMSWKENCRWLPWGGNQ